MGETGFIEPPFRLVKSLRTDERRGRPAVVPVELGIDTFYKVYRATRPRQIAAAEQSVALDPGRFRTEQMHQLFLEAQRFAHLNVPVLLLGERGTGKTALAGWIHVAIITFGGEARAHLELAPAREVSWIDLDAHGGTPMGAAFDLTRDLIEDRSRLSSRAYRPTLVLLSDGQPTDDWREPRQALLGSERAGKAFRMALAIGADSDHDHDVLQAFLAAAGSRVHRSDEARQIRAFFVQRTPSPGGPPRRRLVNLSNRRERELNLAGRQVVVR